MAWQTLAVVQVTEVSQCHDALADDDD
jgi:hypothetical protein